MEHIAKKIAYTTAAQTILRIIEIGIGVVTLGFITRYLSPVGFGEYTTVNALLQFFVILVDFGLYLTLLREISADETRTQSIANNIFTIRLIATSALLIASLILIHFAPYSRDIKTGSIMLSVAFLSSSLIATITALFQKQLRMVSISVINVLNKIATLAAVLIISANDWGIQGIFIASSLIGLATFMAIWQLLKRLPHPIRLWIECDLVYWRHVLREAWPIAVTTALNLVYFKADTIILSLVQSQESVGIYGASYRVLEIISTFPHMFMGLVMPLLTAAWVSRDLPKLQTVWERTFIFFASITVPLVVGGALVGTRLMTVVAGNDFADSGPVLSILMIATAAIFFGTLYTYIVLIIGKQRAMIKFFFSTAILSLVGYCTFIPPYSYWGAAWMTVVSEILIVLSAWIVIRRDVSLPLPWFPLVKILCASIGMGIVTWLLMPAVPLIPLIGSSVLVYGILFLLVQPVPHHELKKLFIG